MWYDEWYGKRENDIVFHNGYMIYPWHRSGSLNNQSSAVVADGDGDIDDMVCNECNTEWWLYGST